MTARTAPRPVAATVTVAVVATLVTVLVTFLPSLRFAYRSVPVHLVLETLDACVASLVALLIYGRYRRTRLLFELLLVAALAILATTSVFFVIVPTLAEVDQPSALTTWAPLLLRLAAAALIMVAALVPHERRTGGRSSLSDLMLLAALLAVVALAAYFLGDRLPVALDSSLTPERSGHPRLAGHPVVLVVQGVHAALFGVASWAFTRRALRVPDPFVTWLGAATTMAAMSRVNYVLFPSIYSQWVYTGDVLRTAFYLLLLAGAVGEIQAYWRAQAVAAVFDERRRLARDLHDGVVQELGFVRAQASALDDPERRGRILGAAERALDEARWAISALSGVAEEPLAVAVRRAALQVADRYDVTTDVEADDVPDVGTERREALVRIVREAVSNAARHAQASAVSVRLSAGELVVSDDGRGFDVEHGAALGGFGLRSMTERGAAVSIVVDVRSARGSGTVVTARW